MGLAVWGSMTGGAHLASCTVGTWVPYRKLSGQGVALTRHPSSPEVKNVYSHNSTLHVWLQEEIYRYMQTWFPTQTKKSTNTWRHY
jgi:hypothetical protein